MYQEHLETRMEEELEYEKEKMAEEIEKELEETRAGKAWMPECVSAPSRAARPFRNGVR